ncbi:MAG TPA: hypothetical protein PKV31_08765, partial [Saprospiraceae bacterium]|nr:hypothetical protein [Saprospiraceae bacterium]
MFRTAIKFIWFDRPKSIGIIVGIVISSFLIGQQLGTLHFITNVMGALIDHANHNTGEIWVVDNTTANVNNLFRLDSRLVNEIRSIPGVQHTYPIVVTSVSVTLPNGRTTPFTIIGSEAPSFAGGPDTARITEGDLSALIRANSVSAEYFDSRSLKIPLNIGTRLEINGKSAIIRLKTRHIQAFGGHFLYSNIDNARFYGNYPNDKVSIISVKIKPGVNVRKVASDI